MKLETKLVSLTFGIILLSSFTLASRPPCSQSNCGAAKCCDDSILGGTCYSEGNYDCVTESSGRTTLCGKNLGSCSSVCYDKSKYHCGVDAKLAIGAESSVQPKPATNAPAPKPATNAPAPKPATNAPAPKPSTATPVCGTQCATGQGCCGVQCFDVKLYSCPIDSVTKVGHLCPLSFYSCNGKCYNPSAYRCVNNDLQQGAESSGNNQPVVTNVVPNPVPNPVPVPSAPNNQVKPSQTADLRIINNCKTTLYFEARFGNFGEKLPGQSSTHTKATPGSYVDYTIPSEGLSGTRFWAKYGCDENGKNCIIGDQMQYYPEGGCPTGGCTPPVDSLFEATWGCKPGSNCWAKNPTTWFDTSQVDGWTIPYKLTANGATNGCDCIGTKCGFSGVDASKLDLRNCPSSENMAFEGILSAVVAGKQTPLSSIDLRIIDKKSNSVIGCMSPCKKLNWGAPWGMDLPESNKPGLYMCCPTPDPKNCRADRGCISPLDCRNGPIEQTRYVKAVHDMAPGIYSYSYDDGVGLHACPAGTVTYTMEYCPAGSSQYPLPL